MKKILIPMIALVLLFSATACSKEKETQVSQPKDTSTTGETQDLGKTLVVYFSVPETTSPENMSKEQENSTVVMDGEVLGNTEYVAKVIQEHISADIFRIEPKTPYTTDHEALIELADKELEEHARPQLKEGVENIEQYDTIYIGYPTWWSDLPMIVYSFLDMYDLSDKTIIPFNTHGGSGFAGTIENIIKTEPNAHVVQDGLSISRDDVEESKQMIIEWVDAFRKKS